MKVVVAGGSGLIGSRLVRRLRDRGHEAIAASPREGIDVVTGAGLAEAMAGAAVVVDVMNSPSWEDGAVLKFFETTTRNLLSMGAKAGVRHHVALSVVGTERLLESGFFRAKMAQERLIEASGRAYTIVRATQFYEFIEAIAKEGTEGDVVRLPGALMQPMSADDVAGAMAEHACGEPRNGVVEIAGPEAMGIDEAARRVLGAKGDGRRVVGDGRARYYGIDMEGKALTPERADWVGGMRLEEWLGRGARVGV